MKTRTRPMRWAFGAGMLLALGFGTRQAFAGAYPVGEGDYCTTRSDAYYCVQGCVEKYGEGTQGTCRKLPGQAFPTCQCIL